MNITEKCTGCMACYNACPFNAIEIIQNEKGFYEPHIIEEKCKKCKKCVITCPQNNLAEKKENKLVYAAWSNSEIEREESTSGGIFSEIAKKVLEEDGIVVGAIYDENFKVVHGITNKEDLQKTRGSKYVQSYIGDSFKIVKKYLDEERKFLGVRPKEKEIAKNSTSGGIAYLISKMVIEENGIVFGSAYDENLMPYQKYATDKKELQQLRGSKYVTSDTKKTFSQVKEFLEEGKKILYIGVPCQIGGLKKFLKKDYENLYTIDIICHGVPSQKIFKKYLENEEKKLGEKIFSYNIRSKNKVDWGMGFCAEIKTKNKTKYKKADFDPYYTAFLKGKIYRECCYECKYGNLDRVGDITLGDLCGIEQFDYDFYDQNGVSLAVINTIKGEKIFNKVKNLVEYRQYNEQQVTKFNGNLKHPTTRPQNRDIIYKQLDEMSFEEYSKKYLANKNKLKYVLKDIMPKQIKVLYKKYFKQVKK